MAEVRRVLEGEGEERGFEKGAAQEVSWRKIEGNSHTSVSLIALSSFPSQPF